MHHTGFLRVLAIITLLSGSVVTTAQEKQAGGNKGRNTVNLFAGTNIRKSFLKGILSRINDAEVSGLPNLGLMYEHMVTDHLGLGVELTHTSLKVQWIDSITTSVTGKARVNMQYAFSMSRIMFRTNLHFFDEGDFDMYVLFSAGYRHIQREVTANALEHDILKYLDTKGIKLPNPFMFGIKPGFGFRYFFSGPIGMHMEIAAGTPLVSGGVSARF